MSAPAELVAAALDYAERGVPVFPCRADTKRPHTEHGFKEASTDGDQIRAWWRRWPDAMVACPTGPDVDAWVLDIDDPAAFEAACNVPLPATRKSVTGKGYHLWFRWDAAARMRNAQRSAKGWPFPKLPGAEVRGEGGYVILPPSRHPSGRAYRWQRNEPACEAPAELLALMRPAPAPATPEPLPALGGLALAVRKGEDTAYGLAALRAECAAVTSASAGAQEKALNDGGLKIGGLVAGGYLSFNTALAQLISAGFRLTSHNAADPWTPARITAKVERALEDGMRSPPAPDRFAALHGEQLRISAPALFGATDDSQPVTIAASPYSWRDPETIPLRPWVYGRYLLRGTVTAVVAPGGLGKSTFLAGTSLALVTGRGLLGKTVWEGCRRVWIWNLEDDLDELSRSIQAAAKHFALSADDLADRLFVDSAMDGSGLCTAVEDEAGFRLLRPVYDALTAELLARQIDVLIIDPFVSSHEVEENANSKIDKIAKAWGRVAKAAHCAIVLVHHTSKAGTDEVTALSARGAVALVNACRSAVVLNRMDADVASKLGIEGDDERRRYFAVMDDKHNRAPAEKADWYRLVSVDLGNGTDGSGDSIGVAEPWTPPDPFDGVTAEHLYRVQCLVDESGDDRESSQATRWVGFAVAQILGLNA